MSCFHCVRYLHPADVPIRCTPRTTAPPGRTPLSQQGARVPICITRSGSESSVAYLEPLQTVDLTLRPSHRAVTLQRLERVGDLPRPQLRQCSRSRCTSLHVSTYLLCLKFRLACISRSHAAPNCIEKALDRSSAPSVRHACSCYL